MSPGGSVSRQERFYKMHSLNLMCCRIIRALLQLLKEFPSWSKMPVLPGQALTFMAPDRTENRWFWIQLFKTKDKNNMLCCSQLFPWTGKGMHWMRCSVVICYLNMLSQICVCNKSHGRDYETKLNTASTTWLSFWKQQKKKEWLVSYSVLTHPFLDRFLVLH